MAITVDTQMFTIHVPGQHELNVSIEKKLSKEVKQYPLLFKSFSEKFAGEIFKSTNASYPELDHKIITAAERSRRVYNIDDLTLLFINLNFKRILTTFQIPNPSSERPTCTEYSASTS